MIHVHACMHGCMHTEENVRAYTHSFARAGRPTGITRAGTHTANYGVTKSTGRGEAGGRATLSITCKSKT